MPAVGDQHRDPVNAVVTANPFDEGPRRISGYTAQEVATLQSRLDKQLGPEYISARSGPSGQKVHYLAAEKCINLANEVFGFNGWSSSIQSIQIDFVDENPNTGKISLGLSVIVRVTLKDGTYHEDVGYGHIENCKGKAAAFEKAKKEGTTDGLKRALRSFGNVLGNCIYDKDYLSKVTRLKITPSKWDAENLHRHPDYAPVKIEPIKDKSTSEIELPPPPISHNTRKENTPHDVSLTLDGDGEFGSDVFDEADFVATNTGNPDEVSLDVEPPQQLQQPHTKPPLPQFQQRPQGYQSRPMTSQPAVVTPSKPEKSWTVSPAPTAQPALHTSNNPTHTTASHTSGFTKNPQTSIQPTHSGNSNSNQDFQHPNNNTVGIVKGESSTNAPNTSSINHAAANNDPKISRDGPTDTSVGFYSARAVDILRENPRAIPMAPKFDPYAESPSIRKTAGIDHTKSVPVSKPMLFGGSSAAPATAVPGADRNFINPSTDVHRRIGAPGGNARTSSPVNKGGFTTSSYRPLTRPALDNRNVTSGTTPQDSTLKRPPLNDLTNVPISGGSTSNVTAASRDIKRLRQNPNNNESLPTNAVPQQPSQQ